MSIRRTAAFAAYGGTILTGSGCVTWDSARFEREVELAFDAPAGLGIAATGANGAIDLVEAERADILVRAHIHATSQERADAVRIVAESGPEWIELGAVWPTERGPSEGVSLAIEAPGGRPVRAQSGNGRILVEGFEGGAELDTSNGAAVVRGHDGDIAASTSNGAVSVYNATGRVRAETSNGGVRVELAPGVSGPVEIDTSNGGVTLVIGPGFAGILDADTSNGTVSLGGETGAAAVHLVTDTRESKSVQIGEGQDRSTIETSNGGIRITIRE